jgi:phosphocarrier protein
MPQQDVEVVNKLGLHARPSARLTQIASKYRAEVFMARNGRRINAKSIMGVMMLAAARGSVVTLETSGDDADAALAELVAYFADGFGEEK